MWSLGQAYETFPQIEEEFSAALDASLSPRGPDMLFDLVADLGFTPGAVVLDVGCGEGRHALRLSERFGFSVMGIDPVPRNIEVARAAAASIGDPPRISPTFELGRAEHLAVRTATVDLIWCRDVLYT